MADPVPMHKDFARWYAAVSVEDNQARRDARWAAVTTITASADHKVVETLLRLACRSRQVPPVAAVQALRDAFKAADDTFEMKGNDRELQVLAAASLAVLMDTNRNTGARAALAATTAGLHGALKPDLPMDLAALGEAAIVRLGEANRVRPAMQGGDMPAFDFGQAAKKMKEVQSWEGAAQAFTLVGDAIGAATKNLAERQANMVRAFSRFFQVQDEELQMLWWLVGQRSFDYDCSFEDVPVQAQSLVFASELAKQTKFLPGPPSITGLLSRAGLKERKMVPITRAVNTAKAEWLRGVLGEREVSPVATPLHEAIKRQLETGAGDAWIAGWAASTGVNNNHELSALTLGNLFYRERLLRLFE
jgi:hypothetical protein